MKTFFAFIALIIVTHQTKAQLNLNPAVDTINNSNNREVVHILKNYLKARANGKTANSFWLAKDTLKLKTVDLYDAHSLYDIHFDEIIVLGITQPQPCTFRARVLFSYLGTDKVRTIWSINDFFLVRQGSELKFTNALFRNMETEHYQTVTSPKITYHFPNGYHYSKLKIDSANNYLKAIEHFFGKTIPGKIEYVTASTCESLYNVLGESFQAGTLSSSTTFCGYFDMKNQLIITSGDEYYKHELLRTLNLIYPDAPDLLKSGITTLWGGSANKPAIYHIKKMYPYLIKHPEVFDKFDDFYYFDDETNPSFILQAVTINYILKKEGKAGLLKLMPVLKTDISIQEFLKEHYQITDLKTFFLDEFKLYSTAKRMEFDDLMKID